MTRKFTWDSAAQIVGEGVPHLYGRNRSAEDIAAHAAAVTDYKEALEFLAASLSKAQVQGLKSVCAGDRYSPQASTVNALVVRHVLYWEYRPELLPSGCLKPSRIGLAVLQTLGIWETDAWDRCHCDQCEPRNPQEAA